MAVARAQRSEGAAARPLEEGSSARLGLAPEHVQGAVTPEGKLVTVQALLARTRDAHGHAPILPPFRTAEEYGAGSTGANHPHLDGSTI